MAELEGAAGGLRIPLRPRSGNEVFGDRGLGILRDYLKAFVTAYGAEAWQSVVSGPDSNIVQTAHAGYDPEQHAFLDEDLPALYLFRTGGERDPEGRAEDFRVHSDRIRLFWILPPAGHEEEQERVSFIHAVGKLIDLALERGRDPSWVIDGDEYPTADSAATEGSVLLKHTGWQKIIGGRWTSGHIAIRTRGEREEDGEALRLMRDCLDMTIVIEERIQDIWGPSDEFPDGSYGPNAGPTKVDLTVSVAEAVGATTEDGDGVSGDAAVPFDAARFRDPLEPPP